MSGAHIDAVHHEKLSDRSRKHNWTIRLHRHTRMAQIFLLKTPGAVLTCGELNFQSSGPVAVFVAPRVVHGFRFPENMEGDVLSLSLDRVDAHMVARIGRLESGQTPLLSGSDEDGLLALEELMRQARAGFSTLRSGRDQLLQHIALLMVMYFERVVHPGDAEFQRPPETERTPHEMQSQTFCDLVETHFANDLSVSEYAAMLGVSAPHLTRVCRKILGTSPNALIRQRRLVEAKRLLEFTRHSVADIGFRAGYRDVGFFCRSFKQAMGMTPSTYRRLHNV